MSSGCPAGRSPAVHVVPSRMVPSRTCGPQQDGPQQPMWLTQMAALTLAYILASSSQSHGHEGAYCPVMTRLPLHVLSEFLFVFLFLLRFLSQKKINLVPCGLQTSSPISLHRASSVWPSGGFRPVDLPIHGGQLGRLSETPPHSGRHASPRVSSRVVQFLRSQRDAPSPRADEGRLCLSPACHHAPRSRDQLLCAMTRGL